MAVVDPYYKKRAIQNGVIPAVSYEELARAGGLRAPPPRQRKVPMSLVDAVTGPGSQAAISANDDRLARVQARAKNFQTYGLTDRAPHADLVGKLTAPAVASNGIYNAAEYRSRLGAVPSLPDMTPMTKGETMLAMKERGLGKNVILSPSGALVGKTGVGTPNTPEYRQGIRDQIAWIRKTEGRDPLGRSAAVAGANNRAASDAAERRGRMAGIPTLLTRLTGQDPNLGQVTMMGHMMGPEFAQAAFEQQAKLAQINKAAEVEANTAKELHAHNLAVADLHNKGLISAAEAQGRITQAQAVADAKARQELELLHQRDPVHIAQGEAARQQAAIAQQQADLAKQQQQFGQSPQGMALGLAGRMDDPTKAPDLVQRITGIGAPAGPGTAGTPVSLMDPGVDKETALARQDEAGQYLTQRLRDQYERINKSVNVHWGPEHNSDEHLIAFMRAAKAEGFDPQKARTWYRSNEGAGGRSWFGNTSRAVIPADLQ